MTVEGLQRHWEELRQADIHVHNKKWYDLQHDHSTTRLEGMAEDELNHLGRDCEALDHLWTVHKEQPPSHLEPLPIVDLIDSWQKVAGWAAFSLLIVLPGVGLYSSCKIIYEYSYRQRHLLPKKPMPIFTKMVEVFLAYVTVAYAFSVTWQCVSAISLTITETKPDHEFLDGHTLENVELHLLQGASFVAAAWFYRILVVHWIQVAAHVQCHKVRLESKLHHVERELFPNNVIGRLKMLKKVTRAPGTDNTGSATIANTDLPTTIPGFPGRPSMVWRLMSVITWLGMLAVQLQMSPRLHYFPHDIELNVAGFGKIGILQLGQIMLSSIAVVLNWHKFVKMTIDVESRLHSNAKLLLFFMLLSKTYRCEKFGEKTRKLIKESLDEYETWKTKENNSQEAQPEKLQRRVCDLFSRPCMDLMMDLTKPEHLKTWWCMRKQIQVDFLDESALANYCSALGALFLLVICLAGLSDYFANKSVLSPGFVLTLFMAVQLAFRLGMMLTSCVEINKFLDMDHEVLLEVNAQVCGLDVDGEYASFVDGGQGSVNMTAIREGSGSVGLMLQAIAQKVSKFEDHQQIFSIKITQKVVIGWVVSTGFTLLSASVKLVATVLAKYDLDDVNKLLHHIPFTLGRA